jgi:hypothetical protein
VRGFFGVAALLVGVVTGSPGRAEGPISLEWIAPEGCPDASAVTARVANEVGGVLPEDRPLIVHATVTRDTAFRLTLRIDGRETRTIEGASCEELASATVFVASMTAESARRETRESRTPPVPVAPDERPAAVEVSAPEAPVESEGDSGERTWRAAVRVEGELAYGGVPVLMGGPRFAVGAEGAAWNAEVALRWLPNVSRDAVESPRVGASFELLSAVLSGGGAWSWGALRLELVLGVEFGVVTGTAFGLTSPGKGSSFWVAVDGGARLRYRWVDRVGVFAALDASAPISRSEWTIDGLGRVGALSPIGLSARLGGEFLF